MRSQLIKFYRTLTWSLAIGKTKNCIGEASPLKTSELRSEVRHHKASLLLNLLINFYHLITKVTHVRQVHYFK